MVWLGSPIRTLSSFSRPPWDSVVLELNWLRHVVRTGDLDVADPVDEVLVAVGIRLPNH